MLEHNMQTNAKFYCHTAKQDVAQSPSRSLNKTQLGGDTLGSLIESAEVALKDLHESIAGLGARVIPLTGEQPVSEPGPSFEIGSNDPDAIRKLRLIVGSISAAADHVRTVTVSLRI
ncbi:hypothetical protein [Burkholderia multivorans]|uniref:hypothetical protein n=1 Tax=Burkholderia multivorans TaxID=87883 RepID=UPI000DACD6DD|nr:hypothetical protein [Burkholderia multivorans]RAC99198.1 hypothetical protein DN503_12030 [Burkholderia multivorans]